MGMSEDLLKRKKLYGSWRWKKARSAFLKQHPDCVDCGAPAKIVDHTAGHSDHWEVLFWYQELWQPVCKPCHSKRTIHRDEGGFGFGRGHRGRLGGAKGSGGQSEQLAKGLHHGDSISLSRKGVRDKPMDVALAKMRKKRLQGTLSQLEESTDDHEEI